MVETFFTISIFAVPTLIVVGLGYVCTMWWLRRTGRVAPPSSYVTGTGLIVYAVMIALAIVGLAVAMVAPHSSFGAWLRDRNLVPFLLILGAMAVVAELILAKLGRPTTRGNGAV
jgi:hypothetical protein